MTKTAEKAILPALRPRPALERSDHVGRDPAAIEIAFLRLHPLAVDVAGIHASRVEGDVVRDRLVAGGRRLVEPGGVLRRTAGDRDGVVARVAGGAGRWHLLVAARDADRSIAALDAYDAERRSAAAGEEAPEYGPTYAGLLVAVLLVGFYGVTGPADPGSAWARAGSASAELIVRGQGWRAVTALTLHANPAHLVGGVLGVAAALLVARPPGRPAQWVLALGALAAVAGSWLVALRAL